VRSAGERCLIDSLQEWTRSQQSPPKFFVAVPLQILRTGPEGLLVRKVWRATVERVQRPRRVVGDGQFGGGVDGVVAREGEKSLLECPMAKLAQRETVSGIVVLAQAPRFDVGRLDGRVVVRRQDANAAEGTSMIVGLHDGLPEPFVTGGLTDFGGNVLIGGVIRLCTPQQVPSVLEGPDVNRALLGEDRVDRLGEVGLDQRRAQNVARLVVRQETIQSLVKARPVGVVPELSDGAKATSGLDHVFTAGLGNEVPEVLARQVIEWQRDVASLLFGHGEIPVLVEQIEKTGIQVNFVSLDGSFCEPIKDRQQEQWLVWCSVLRRLWVMILIFILP
jgi:hypothetical protein